MSSSGEQSDGAESNDTSTEAEVARARAEDGLGFAPLYERLAPSLEAWAEIRVSGALRGFVEAGDLVQEVWWRAMDAFDRYDPARSSFRAWMFQIATHVLLEWSRKRRRRVKVESQSLAERASSLPPDLARQATSVGRGLQHRDSASKLVAIATGLSKDDRDVFLLCGLEGLSATEAARLAGSEAGRVRKRWQRLREKLAVHPICRELELA